MTWTMNLHNLALLKCMYVNMLHPVKRITQECVATAQRVAVTHGSVLSFCKRPCFGSVPGQVHYTVEVNILQGLSNVPLRATTSSDLLLSHIEQSATVFTQAAGVKLTIPEGKKKNQLVFQSLTPSPTPSAADGSATFFS